MNYGPPLSDSDEDSYDGFMFSADYDDDGNRKKREKPAQIKPQRTEADQIYRSLFDSIRNGDLDTVQNIFKNPFIKINEPIVDSESTPLLLACQERKVEIVKYLLNTLNADANGHVNMSTPLMIACLGSRYELHDFEYSSRLEASVLEIVEMLLAHGAIVNVHNLKGETAFMFAAENGFVSVIKLLIENNVSIEANDNEGKTAIFYAVTGNQYDATKALIEAGAIVNIEDRYKNSPKSLARQNGYEDIEQLFPEDDEFIAVPFDYLFYSTYKDYIPSVYPNEDRPAYAPDVIQMMAGMRSNCLEYKFYESRVSFEQLLTINDGRLQEIGIEYPFQRKRILIGLLKYHEKGWTKGSLCIPKKPNNIQQCFYVYANCLRQLIILKSSLHFIQYHELFKNVEMSKATLKYRAEIGQMLNSIQLRINNLLKTLREIERLLAIPPSCHFDTKIVKQLLDKNTTFRMHWYRRFKIIACIGFGFTALTMIKRFIYRTA